MPNPIEIMNVRKIPMNKPPITFSASTRRLFCFRFFSVVITTERRWRCCCTFRLNCLRRIIKNPIKLIGCIVTQVFTLCQYLILRLICFKIAFITSNRTTAIRTWCGYVTATRIAFCDPYNCASASVSITYFVWAFANVFVIFAHLFILQLNSIRLR